MKEVNILYKSHEKSTLLFNSCENRYPKSFSRSRSRCLSGNFLNVGAGAETNCFGSTTLGILANVIWGGKKYEKRKRNRGNGREKRKGREGEMEKEKRKWEENGKLKKWNGRRR